MSSLTKISSTIIPSTSFVVIKESSKGCTIDGIGPVNIRKVGQTLSLWDRFCDWFAGLIGRKSEWLALPLTTLGPCQIEVTNPQVAEGLKRVSKTSQAALATVAHPAKPVSKSSQKAERVDEVVFISEGRTALHEACINFHHSLSENDNLKANEELGKVRNLILKGANPYQRDNNGRTPFHFAAHHLPLLKILTRTENHPAFAHCKTIHDFWAVIYPPHSYDWEKIKVLKPSSIFENLSQAISEEERAKLPSKAELAAELEEEEFNQYATQIKDAREKGMSHLPIRKPLTSEQICNFLRKKHPLFDAAWKQFGDHPPRIQENQSSGQIRIHKKGEDSYYTAHDHVIHMETEGTYSQKIPCLFHETMNALQQDECNKLRGDTFSREDLTFLSEFVEFRSYNGLAMLLPKDYRSGEFTEYLERQHMVADGLEFSHSDHYRIYWDKYFSILYIVNQREEFEARLNQLFIQRIIQQELG